MPLLCYHSNLWEGKFLIPKWHINSELLLTKLFWKSKEFDAYSTFFLFVMTIRKLNFEISEN